VLDSPPPSHAVKKPATGWRRERELKNEDRKDRGRDEGENQKKNRKEG
jgi:hypothetical protein